MKEVRNILFVVLCVLVVACSGGRRQMRVMDSADAVIDSLPDSALNIMKRVDASVLHTEEGKARYSLLMTLAMLRTDKEFDGDSLLAPAYKYYGHRDEPSREAMLTHYAKSFVISDPTEQIKEYDAAISHAAGRGKGRYVALSWFNKSSNYSAAVMLKEARESADSGLVSLRMVADSSIMAYGYKVSGTIYNQDGKFDAAKSEFEKGLDLSGGIDGKTRNELLVCYAYTHTLLDKDAKAVLLFDSVISLGGVDLSPYDLCAYSRSLAKVGRVGEALGILNENDFGSGDFAKANRFYSLAIVYGECGDSGRMESASDSFHYYENKSIKEIVGDSLSYNQGSGMRSDMKNVVASSRIMKRNLSVIILSSVVAVVLSGLVLCVILRWNKRRLAKERMSGRETEVRLQNEIESWRIKSGELNEANERIVEEIACLRQTVVNLTQENGDLSRRLEGVKADAAISEETALEVDGSVGIVGASKIAEGYEAKIRTLQETLFSNFRQAHSAAASFCNHTPAEYAHPERFAEYEEKRNLLLSEYRKKDRLEEMGRMIDEFADCFITGLLSEPGINKTDICIVIYDICGFNYVAIGIILCISEKASSVRRSRLKNKLSGLDGKLKEACVKYVSFMKR